MRLVCARGRVAPLRDSARKPAVSVGLGYNVCLNPSSHSPRVSHSYYRPRLILGLVNNS